MRPRLPQFVSLIFLFGTLAADDYQPRNTQRQGEEPPSPVEALYQMSLPEGFAAQLFAHEPAVRQPIAMTSDDRGRLWVVESYSYEEWERRQEDRIIILEDANGDGRHDKRTPFSPSPSRAPIPRSANRRFDSPW